MQNYASLKNIINSKAITSLSLVCFLIVALGNLICTNILSTEGINVSASEAEIMSLEKENQLLSVKIEEESNLKGLESQAKSVGFVRTSNLVFAPTTTAVALR